MFSFFRNKPKESIYKIIEVDMHSHLIPGIDDGSPDNATSIELMTGLKEIGFRKLITTPHIFLDYYPNSTSIVNDGLKTLQTLVSDHHLGIEINAAAEYYTDNHFEKLIDKNDILSFSERKYVLIEMSFLQPSPNLDKVIFNLITKGYQPILAHPERYGYWHQNDKIFDKIIELGCLLQLNILSLVGYYGRPVQKKAHSLLKSNQITFLGTDLHHKTHLEALKENQFNRELAHIFNKYPFKNKEL